MTIKQSLKFLYAFIFSVHKCRTPMFVFGQSHQIARAIIILNPIQMMNYITIRDWLFMIFFPDKDVFPHISTLSRSWVGWIPNKNITFGFNSATFPTRTSLTQAVATATLLGNRGNGFATINTFFLYLFISLNPKSFLGFPLTTFPMRTIFALRRLMTMHHAKFRPTHNQLPTYGAGMLISFFIIFAHMRIIPHLSSRNKHSEQIDKTMREKPEHPLRGEGW